MNLKWNNYIQSLSEEYGKLTNLIWISKKREKFILEFAYARMLIINNEKYRFKDILSCKIEKAPYKSVDTENATDHTEMGINNSDPQILLIGINNNTDMLLSITVWSKSVATAINDLMQEIIKSNKICHE